MSSSITINSNLSSLNAQRRLGSSTSALRDSYTRLSSGLRINKASDDAAGLAISESLKVDDRVLGQAVRNLEDGISTVSIADGALSQLSSIVIRLHELAEQASNGTLGNKQRAALDKEAQSLSDEYTRIARSTEFNNRYLFHGDYGELRLQAGYGTQGLIASGLGGAVGTGEFKEATTYSVGANPWAVANGDFNNDGALDVIVTDNDANSVSVLLGDGTG